jgi:hypothetical protein
MSAIIEVLRMIGLEGSAVAAASCVLIAFYLFRAKRIGSMAATMSAAAVAYVTVSLVVLAVVIALGWAEPNPGVAIEETKRAIAVAIERGSGPAWRAFRWIVKMVM